METRSSKASTSSDPTTKNNKALAHAYADGYRRIYANFRVVQIGDRIIGDGEFRPANRIWSGASQVSEVSYYPEEIGHSNDNNPEHEIVYVNESISNLSEPTYYNMNMFGMSVRSTGRLVDVSQLRYWIPGGVEVDRTYPGAFIFDDQTDDFGRSNLFTDLIWYLLTNKDTGSGDIVSTAMLDKPSFELTSKFLVQNRIFCDTVVQDPINIREYATQLAPLMLCNFVMKAGEFAVVPGIPVTSTGAIDTGRLVPTPSSARATSSPTASKLSTCLKKTAHLQSIWNVSRRSSAPAPRREKRLRALRRLSFCR